MEGRQRNYAMSAPAKRSRAETARMVLAMLVGVFAVLFAVLNLDRVKVNWIVGTWNSPLIVVIALMFLLGMGADRLLLLRRRAKRHS